MTLEDSGTQRRYGARASVACYVAALLVWIATAPFNRSATAQAATTLLVVANKGMERLDHDALRAVFLRKRLVWSNQQRMSGAERNHR